MSPYMQRVLLCISFCFVLFSFALGDTGYTLELLIGSNYTNGLTASESNPKFSSDAEYKLLFLDRRNNDLYYSVGRKVIRKLDSNGIVSNVAGSLRSIGRNEPMSNIQDYYYALDRELSNIGGLVVDPLSNEVYYLNEGIYMERIRNSDKKSLIAAGNYITQTTRVATDESIYYPTFDYARGLAINSKNEIYILGETRIYKYNIANYSISYVIEFENYSYTQIVLSQDETFFYAKDENNQVYKITLNGQVTPVVSLENLMYIDSVDNDLYLLSQTGVYLFRNETTTLIAGGNQEGTYKSGMNATALSISRGTTMMVSNNRDIYLTDSDSAVAIKIDSTTQQVIELFPRTNFMSTPIFTAKNMTFYNSIKSAVQDTLSDTVYICSNNNVYRFDGNQVVQLNLNIGCDFVAVNPSGSLFIAGDNYNIYEIVNGIPMIYAGNNLFGNPTVGSLANQTSFNTRAFGFFSNGNMFVQSGSRIYMIDSTTRMVQSYATSFYGNDGTKTTIDSKDNLYVSDTNGIFLIFPNGSSILVAGVDPPLARSVHSQNVKRSISQEGEDAFAFQINPTSMVVGADGKLVVSYDDIIRTVDSGLLWTRNFVDSQQGPMNSIYIHQVILLGRYKDGLMLTNPNGNLLFLKPTNGFTCFGIDPISSNVCSGYGTCIGPNRCTCQSTNFGFECQYSTCNDISGFYYQRVCGGIGTCSVQDVCTCPAGFTGLSCSEPLYYICNGIPSINSTIVCSGKGNCVGMDKCSCNAGRVGSNCQYDFCVSTWNSNTDNLTCSVPTASNVEVNQEVFNPNQLNSRTLRFNRNPSVSITFPSNFFDYISRIYPEINDQYQLTVVSSLFDPVLDTSKDLLVVGPITSLSLYKNTSEVLSINNLPNPIVIQFNGIKIDKASGPFNYSCQFFDTASNSWSSSGIRSTITSSSQSPSFYTFSLQCETYHLTSFSVIDMNYKKANRDDTITLSGLTTGGIVAIAVSLGAACLICVVIALVVAAISGVCMWTKHNKKKMMSE